MTQTNGHPIPAAPHPHDEVHAHPAHPLMRSPFVQNVLPFLSSLTVHAAVVLLGVTAAKVIVDSHTRNLREGQVGVAASHLEEGLPDMHLLRGAGIVDDRPVMQDQVPDSTTDGIAQTRSLNVAINSSDPGSEGTHSGEIIGAGEGILGSRVGGPGTGPGEGGPLARFGNLEGRGNGPTSPMFIQSRGAKQVVFVCDASGSMINKMAALKQELVTTVTGMRRGSFNVIFFQDRRFLTFNEAGLLPATSANKAKAMAFLDEVGTSGTTDPIPGLELAFRQKPELIFLLTDGDFPDNAAVRARVRELNKEKKVRINTIAFVSDGEVGQEVQFIELLTEIAKENGGQFRLVKESDLDK